MTANLFNAHIELRRLLLGKEPERRKPSFIPIQIFGLPFLEDANQSKRPVPASKPTETEHARPE